MFACRVVADQAGGKHTGDSRNRGKGGSRRGRSQRRTVKRVKRRTFGEKDDCAHEARGTCFRDGLGMSAEFW